MTQEEWLQSNTFYCKCHNARMSKKSCEAMISKAKQQQAVKDNKLEHAKFWKHTHDLNLEKCIQCEKFKKGDTMPPAAQKIEKLPTPEMKQCITCQQWLPMDRFGKNHATPDGMQSHCKKCMIKKIADAKSANNRICKTGINKPKSGAIVIDFSDYPDTWTSLKKLASEEFSTPEMQALFMLYRNLPAISDQS